MLVLYYWNSYAIITIIIVCLVCIHRVPGGTSSVYYIEILGMKIAREHTWGGCEATLNSLSSSLKCASVSVFIILYVFLSYFYTFTFYVYKCEVRTLSVNCMSPGDDARPRGNEANYSTSATGCIYIYTD